MKGIHNAFILGTLCLIMWALHPAKTAVICPCGWIPSEESGSCIQFSDYTADLSWTDARLACQAQGGDLVKIVNEEMNNFIAGELACSDYIGAYWIGLSDIVNNSMFAWLDESTKAEYTNWNDGEPDEDDDSHCVYLYVHDDARWGDLACSDTYSYICEIPAISMVQVSTRCPCLWAFSDESDTCINISGDQLPWADARIVCQAQGGDLVKIVNEEMNDFIADQLAPIGYLGAYWTGLNDIVNEGEFVWLDELTEAEYTDWNQDEPDIGDTSHCVYLYGRVGYKWADMSCSNSYFYICEISANDVMSGQGLNAGAVTGIVIVCLAIVLIPATFFSFKFYSRNRQAKLAAQFNGSAATLQYSNQGTIEKQAETMES